MIIYMRHFVHFRRVHQGNFGGDFSDSVAGINGCLQIFGVSALFENGTVYLTSFQVTIQFDIQAQQKQV